MTGIPTTYAGVRFRSRAEARWAIVFDWLQWSWEYEPIDLAGYIPDFIISEGNGRLLFEVKAEPSEEEMSAAKLKIERSGWDGEAVILTSFDAENGLSCQPEIGLFGERVATPDGPGLEWGTARMFFCLSCGQFAVLTAEGAWRCRWCGAYDGHVGACGGALSEAWKVSGNRVQWRAG